MSSLSIPQLQALEKLDYPVTTKTHLIYVSESETNFGRKYIGTDRTEFCCWMDDVVQAGFYRAKDGSIRKKWIPKTKEAVNLNDL